MHKISLKDWVILLTIVPTALISFGLAGYFSYNRSAELDEFLNLRAQSIIEPLAITSKAALINNNREELRAAISAAHRSQSSLIKSIAIFTLDNQIFVTSAYHGNINLMRLKAGEKIPTYTQGEYSEDFIIFRTPIIDEKLDNKAGANIFGYIAIHVDKSRIKFKQQSQYIIAFTMAFLSVLLSSIFALKLIRNVAKPIHSMVHAIDRIREGKLESRVSGQLLIGELNFLKTGINAMAQSLGNYQNEMQGSIDQATIDLRESLEQYEIQNVELSIAKKKSQEANKIKSEFLANMSHELRTPLNAILGFSQILQDDESLTTEQTGDIQHIYDAGEHLLELINNVLDLAKIEVGQLTLSITDVSFSEVMQATGNILKTTLNDKGIQLRYNPSIFESVILKADAFRLKQVLLNLLSNAIKYNKPNGTISLDCQYMPGDIWRIEITDTGKGIAAILISAGLYAYNLILQRQQSLLAGPIEIAFFQNCTVQLIGYRF